MKTINKILLIFGLLQILHVNCYAHKEWVHQYIVKEAYKFLENEIGEIPEIKDYLGLNYTGAGGSNPWNNQNSIVVGSWREDLEDIAWEYGGLQGFDPSCVHFWLADNGEYALTDMPLNDPVPNAWMKSKYLLFGADLFENFLYYDHRPALFIYNGVSIRILGSYRSYRNLPDYLRTKEQLMFGFRDLMGDRRELIEKYYVELSNKRWPYNIVGRICHLLADMSVPAHVHNDLHPCQFYDGDAYELWISSNDVGDCNQPHTSFRANGKDGIGKYGTGWDAITAREQGGFIYEIFSLPNVTAIQYLFYTLNQLSDHYPSFDQSWVKDYSGNNNIVTNNDPILNAYYNLLGDPLDSDPEMIECADVTLNYCIRVTATFLYWLAVKTEIVECPETLFLQNNVYYGNRNPYDTQYKAQSKIYAGKNVRMDLPVGNVINTSGSISEYIASDEIILKDGFISESGSNLHLYLSNLSCNLDNYESENNIYANQFQNYGKKHLDEITTLDSAIQVNSTKIYILEDAVFFGDTVNYLKFGQTVYKIEPNYKDDVFGDSALVMVERICFVSDSVHLYYIDSLLNTEFIRTLIGRYFIEMTIENTVITKIDTIQNIIMNTNAEIQIFPNPSITSIAIYVELSEESEITVIVSDESGNIIKTLTKNEKLTKGVHNFEYNLNAIPQGNYLIGVYDKKRMISKRFVKIN